jgi:hypothetical protein
MRCKWLCAVLLSGWLSGCFEDDDPCQRFSETHHIEGEVKLTTGAKSGVGEDSSAPIVLQAYDSATVLACSGNTISVATGGGPRVVGELVLNGPGKFAWDVHVEGYESDRSTVWVAGFLDADEDGSCTPGELRASAEYTEDGALTITLEPGSTCTNPYYL